MGQKRVQFYRQRPNVVTVCYRPMLQNKPKPTVVVCGGFFSFLLAAVTAEAVTFWQAKKHKTRINIKKKKLLKHLSLYS